MVPIWGWASGLLILLRNVEMWERDGRMFEAINNWIVEYMETPNYQRTVECECLFFLAIVIYLALAALAIFLIWLIVKGFKKFTDRAVQKEAEWKEMEKDDENK